MLDLVTYCEGLTTVVESQQLCHQARPLRETRPCCDEEHDHTKLNNYSRGLLLAATDGNIVKDTYAYDENGNVRSVTDATGANTSLTMGYDGLDRVKTATAPNLWARRATE